MEHYLEFTLRGNKKTPVPALMSALLNQTHYALVTLNTNKLGVSFPAYGTTLGDVMRVHGEAHLLKLFILNIDKLQPGIAVSDILKTPDGANYGNFYRIRPSKQNSKLQAGIKSGHISDPKKYILKMCQEVLSEPFFQSMSASTRQSYKRFVKHEKSETSVVGEFDSFGMSKTATVPLF